MPTLYNNPIDNTKDEKLLLVKNDIIDDWLLIQNRIFSEIARNIWGNHYYYHILLNQDVQFQKAINSIDQAKSIMQ